ncbi:zinc finger C3H1 domain-containing protein isoform X2 [Syngnathoides biaculeatus]|uniref:zinc finger C3H1 domain-containing protein isoform X2 n=1 Tax=Syngnathoides biaculeatus TaxID=300417 RepID=UPI002ADD83D5|nr:zinc finger C3H1 domain-containing protein isoform X2 [Syngnathoides biaculeatus]
MDAESAGRVQTDDVELEDGEICDDDGEESSAARRGEGRRSRPLRGPRPPYMAHPPADFRHMMAYDVHGAQCGPDRPHAPCPPLPPPPPPPAGLAPMCGGPGPRPSFWERSHGALGRFRHRTVPNGGRGAWNRGTWAGPRPPMGRYGPGENSHNRNESPGRKQKPLGRNLPRRAPAKCGTGAESFEDLLSKYKQIQIELECIRKEESMALEAEVQGAEGNVQVVEPKVQGSEVRAQRAEAKVPGTKKGPAQAVPLPQESAQIRAQNKKSFQAFNIKPLRVKLFTPPSLDTKAEEERKAMQAEPEAPAADEVAEAYVCCGKDAKDDCKTPGGESSASSDDVFICLDELDSQVEEEDLSELQLRLVALQSASRKWHQKEQQAMKKSREPAAAVAAAKPRPADRRTRTRSKPQDRERDKAKPGPRERPKTVARTPSDRSRGKSTGPASAGKQAVRKRQLRTWKLQRKHDDDDEWHKREDEIRKIRDLSNQDEQYKRFMKLVGGKMHSSPKVRGGEARKSSTGRTGPDGAGNLYQYDNYDEVAMETDSEPGSPARPPLTAEDPAASFPLPPLYETPFAACAPPPPPPLPPPTSDPTPPPKPPFADEEEEEEMLLRETCLMSMASKRVVTAEEPFWSGPPSPSAAPPAGLEQPARGNLSAVSLNTMTTQRGNKFTRGGASRAPLLLPRHKSVVVSLNESDDSDSDLEVAAQGMFGGLEFMIKEARRTAEVNATKSKGASEKENNPMRTPDALPEAKKAEYRFLREELASREKQKASHPDAGSAAAVDPAVPSPGSEAERRLLKQRELLSRDETLLKNLLQQQLKKSESLKAAESKAARLREQTQAAEKIVLANKTLLKKIQEQVRRVEHRVSIKKTLAARLEQELLWTRKATGREPKRKAGAVHKPARKLQRVDAANHFAALMAQKQRLQQLESEYAQKIQQLKEAQALRNKAAPTERRLKPVSLPDPKVSLTGSPGPPQPSLHDLTQDVLVLESEDAPEADDLEPERPETQIAAPEAAYPRPRRRSFRRSDATKPNLEQPSSAPAPVPVGPPAAKPVESSEDGPVAAGPDLEALRRQHRQRPGLAELVLEELTGLGEPHKTEEEANVPKSTKVKLKVKMLTADAEASPSACWPNGLVPLRPYRSPLLVFKSYRFSPYYRTKEKLSLSSATYSNAIRPQRCFCRFDLTGTCNDDGCSWQHVRSCALTGNLLFQDVLSYNLSLIGCSDASSDGQVGSAAGGRSLAHASEKYMSKLLGPHRGGMAADQTAVFLVSKVNESRRHVPPFTTWKGKRKWRPSALSEQNADGDCEEDASGEERPSRTSDVHVSRLDACVTSEDKRYFLSDTDDICKLESGVSDNPGDTQLWIKLAFKYLRQDDTPPSECLEAALNTLSRALEHNCDHPEVWTHYLTLFSRRGHRDEVQEMCQMAVEHAPHRSVWWNYLSLASTFEGKDSVCERLLHFLRAEAACGSVSEERSFQLLEAVLYRVHLNVFTGRSEAALAIFRDALKDAGHHGIAERLRPGHRALAWLAYIHLKEFGRLPAALYDPLESGPSGLVGADPFLLPWRSASDVRTPHEELIGLFEEGVRRCGDDSLSPSERTLACLPLHTNFLFLHRLLGRFEEAVSSCEVLLEACPTSCVLQDVLCELLVRSGKADGAAASWLAALAKCPDDAEVFYHCCRFLMAQDKWSVVTPLFRGFVSSLCDGESAHVAPVHILRSVLGLPTDGAQLSAVARKDLEDRLHRQRSFLHLLHCRWHWLHGSTEDALDAFERALGSAVSRHELHRLWTDYLRYCSVRAAERLPDLVLRCLGTVPARLEVPFDSTHFWTSYRFHNEVVALYLSCVDASQHAALLERLHYTMPANVALALRLMRQEAHEGNLEHVRFQARMLTASAPKCLPAWNIAIAAETELKQPTEVRRSQVSDANAILTHVSVILNIPEFSSGRRRTGARRPRRRITRGTNANLDIYQGGKARRLPFVPVATSCSSSSFACVRRLAALCNKPSRTFRSALTCGNGCCSWRRASAARAQRIAWAAC